MTPKTIVMVEDNADNRKIYSVFLTHFGYRVLEAEHGEAGISLVTRWHPDLVLMDISLPRLDGFEVTRRLKGDPTTAMIPVVALTAHAYPEDQALAREIGFDAYLTKPIDPRLVLEEVERFLGPSTH